jgi:hypothetical protein
VGNEILDGLFVPVGSSELLEFQEEFEALLVSQTVKWASEAVETGGEGEIGVGEGRANQVGSVGRNISSLVIGVDNEVKSHQLVEALVGVSNLSCKVG